MRTMWTSTGPADLSLNFPVGSARLPTTTAADELCDELTLHTFDCDDCIAGREHGCDTFRSLNSRITKAGGPSRGLLLTF